MQFLTFDKPKVENAVLVVERWILARLRNRRFFSLAELNSAIAGLLVDLNNRAFKKLPGCRKSAFELLDAPALRPLAATRFELCSWKSAKVNILCGLAISVAFAPQRGRGWAAAMPGGHRILRYSERRNCIRSDPSRRRGALPAGSSCASARDFISRSICA